MRADTQTITIDANLSKVFRFVSNPENLPHWARAFCQAIRPDGDAWLVSSPQGEIRVRYRTDEALGVIDFHLSPAPGLRRWQHRGSFRTATAQHTSSHSSRLRACRRTCSRAKFTPCGRNS